MSDSYVSRLSVADGRGGEICTTIPYAAGKTYRQARENAVEMLFEARELGMQPGETTQDMIEAEYERRRKAMRERST